jgi:hypothetical protein
MLKKLLNRSLNCPWFYFALSLIHQILVFAPGEFPQLFPDSGSYFSANPQRTPIYPWILATFNNNQVTAGVQILMFALAAAAFHVICRMVIEKIPLPKGKECFIWIGSLYFATNFELIQFSPTILTESFGISFFVFYFFSVLKWQRDASKFYYVLSFLVFPVLLFLLRPSFILVPAAVSFFFVLKYLFEKKSRLFVVTALCLVAYLGSTQAYAYWNRTRLGHVGISDILQHQIFANYMARGILMEEAFKLEASTGLRAFGDAYAITKQDPALKDSQYSLFEKWQEMNPGKDLYTELVPVNKELLAKRPWGYVDASLRNLSTLIDGRASFNYYTEIKTRGVVSQIYFGLQFIVDNIFFLLWFTALFYYVWTFRTRELFGVENLIFVTVATQFLTIGFLGYSELRRQSIGVASIQMLFVLVMWVYLLKRRWEKKAR